MHPLNNKTHIALFIFSILILFAIFSTVRPQIGLALEAGWSITAPSAVSLPSVQWSIEQGTTTYTFTTDVVVSNDQSTSQGFTTQVTSTEFIHSSDQTLFMGYTSFDIKTGTVTTSQPAGINAPLEDLYSAFSGVLSTSDPLTFMTADQRTRNAGSWTIIPTIRLRIPAKQRTGTYNATLTFSLS